MMKPSVLITGGAGFIGINLCRFLLARGYEVRSLDIAPFHHPERAMVDVMLGDVRDSAIVAQAMRGVSCVVHAASAPTLSTAEEIFSANVVGTGTVLQTAVRHRVPRFIFLSSTAVYGVQAHHLMHEGDPLHGTGSYAEAKIGAEHLCEASRLSGSCVTILRPTTIVGPGRRGVLEALYEFAFEGRNFPTLGSGRTPSQVLDVADACEAIYQCLVMRPDLVNDTFNLGPPVFGTIREGFQTVLDRAGHGKRVIVIPRGPASALLKLLEHLRRSPSYPWIHDTAGEATYVSVRHIDGKLGFRPRYSSSDALLRHYELYARHRGKIPSKSSARSCLSANRSWNGSH
jgi:nucleoside-diphosphate-sugar epimerase